MSLIKRRFFKFKILIYSLYYNNHISTSYVADILMEPLFWFVDNFAHCLGPFFVVAVLCLTLSVILNCILVGLPYWIDRSVESTAFIVLLGLWLLSNVSFHYYKGCTVHPGFPPEGTFIQEAVSICKKCISPKPPRTHHCSVCNRCILKMDHHCPWLNNCVGFRNHKHFFLYMVYTTLGVTYIMAFGTELFLERVWFYEEELVGYPIAKESDTSIADAISEEAQVFPKWQRGVLIYMAFISAGVFIALGSLIIWHARLITRGETSIEANINKSEAKRYLENGGHYVNPYDLGWKRNWAIFLGVEDLTIKKGIFYVLLPYNRSVRGDGLTWPSLFADSDDLRVTKQL